MKLEPIVPIVVTMCILCAVIFQLIMVPAISFTHPNLAHVLSFAALGCCLIAILLIWALVFRTHIDHRQKAILTWWRSWRSYVVHRFALRKKTVTHVPVAQLTHLRDQVDQLWLTLYALTPADELALRTHFQMHGEAMSSLVPPRYNRVLAAECQGLIKALTAFGFPDLDTVSLKQHEFEYFLKWEKDLKLRLHQTQQQFQILHSATQLAMSSVKQLFQSVGEIYPFAQNEEGYLRLLGAFTLLEKIWQDQRSLCSSDLILSCAQGLQRDMEKLIKQLQQKVA